MNVNIFLRQFKGGGEVVVKLIREGNSKELEGDRLKCLEKLLPDSGVIDELKSFSGDKTKLGKRQVYFTVIYLWQPYGMKAKMDQKCLYALIVYLFL